LAAEPRVVGAIDLAHAAVANEFADLVWPDLISGLCCSPAHHPSANAELLHHERLIEMLPSLDGTTVAQVIDDQPPDVDTTPGCGQRAKSACVRSGAMPPNRGAVAVHDLLVQFDVQIWKR